MDADKIEKGVICYEDVYMEILKMGGTLKLVDHENGCETKEISIKDVHERVAKTPIEHLTDAIEENSDAITADVILQTVFYEDVIFG
jgi:AAA+ superfamily predicted ATPase